MAILKTPEERFESLPDFQWPARHVPVGSLDGVELEMAFIDEGPRDAPVVLLLHGEPTWSFLYRKMIPVIVSHGLRAVAPDLIGFGRSDKPSDRGDYTYASHMRWVHGFLEATALGDVTLFCQDWGGLLGLRLAAEAPERFVRIVAANTFLPTGDRKPGDAFFAWRTFSQEVEELPVGGIVRGGCVTSLEPDVVQGYDAPFPDETYKAGVRQFPMLVPVEPDDPAAEANRAAWQVLERWDKPFLTIFGDSDPITRGADRVLQERIPGAAGRNHVTVDGAGHFIQEDKGEEVARLLVEFVEST